MLKKEDVLIEDPRSNLRGNEFTGLAKLRCSPGSKKTLVLKKVKIGGKDYL